MFLLRAADVVEDHREIARYLTPGQDLLDLAKAVDLVAEVSAATALDLLGGLALAPALLPVDRPLEKMMMTTQIKLPLLKRSEGFA
jgi:hypothetical protein